MGYGLTWIVLSASISYLVARTVYRLYFHPLSKFPGPKLAAATRLYEFYYDVIVGGTFTWQIKKMHEKYDPEYFDTIYSSKKQEKDPYMVGFGGAPLSSFATIDHEHHRRRRALVNPFFSKMAIQGVEHIVHDKVEKACTYLKNAYGSGSVVSLDDLFAALTADVISDYTYGESMGFLDHKELKNEYREAINGLASIAHLNRFFPSMIGMLDVCPDLIQWLRPILKTLIDVRRDVLQKGVVALRENETPKPSSARKTIFDSISDNSLPPNEITPPRIRDEAIIMLVAGTETTARILSMGAYHLYRNPVLLQNLRKELQQVMPDTTSQASWAQLEQLPYMNGLVNESLRVAHSVTARMPRISPTDPLVYKDWTIPAGTPVSQSTYFVHTNPEIFPDPDTFRVERWIEASDKGDRLTRYLVPFTKGNRICLGMNLAYSELYLLFAALVRRFDLDVGATNPENVRVTRDFIIGLPESGRFQVDAVVSGIVEK